MKRTQNIRTVFSKKFDTYQLTDIWKEVFGLISKTGIWIVYGAEKNGKTWFALKLADYLSQFDKTLYISAEEGLEKEFVDAMKRAKLTPDNTQIQFMGYEPLATLSKRLNRRESPSIVLIDNITIYKDELSYGGFQKFRNKHPNKLIIFLAHEEKNEPYTATAKMIKRLSKIIIRVQGLACFVSGRCPGGTLMIDEAKAALYHGNEVTTKTQTHENNP